MEVGGGGADVAGCRVMRKGGKKGGGTFHGAPKRSPLVLPAPSPLQCNVSLYVAPVRTPIGVHILGEHFGVYFPQGAEENAFFWPFGQGLLVNFR